MILRSTSSGSSWYSYHTLGRATSPKCSPLGDTSVRLFAKTAYGIGNLLPGGGTIGTHRCSAGFGATSLPLNDGRITNDAHAGDTFCKEDGLGLRRGIDAHQRHRGRQCFLGCRARHCQDGL